MPLWFFWTTAAVLYLSAIASLYRGLRGDRCKGRLRCPKCWYDMTGSFEAGKLECPECGNDAATEKRLRKNHRRWWPMVLAVVLIAPHLFSSYILYGWSREQPAVTAIEDLGGTVKWQSIAPDTLLKCIPQVLHRYCNRVIEVSGPGTTISDTEFIHIENLTQLERLYLSGTNVTDVGLAHLERLSQLRRLDLNGTQVTDTGLKYLKDLTQLKDLALGGTQVSDAGLAHLQELRQLEILSLGSTQVTGAGLKHLRGLSQLQSLRLCNSKITDDGLIHIKQLPQLKWLFLDRTKITDAGLKHLHGLTQLKCVRLVDMRGAVSMAGSAELRKALPDCVIWHGQMIY